MATNSTSRYERFLFWVACHLAGLLVRAVHRMDRDDATAVDRAIAQLTLGFVSAVGRVIDWVPFGGPVSPRTTLVTSHRRAPHRNAALKES
jgi:hypothetical protein